MSTVILFSNITGSLPAADRPISRKPTPLPLALPFALLTFVCGAVVGAAVAGRWRGGAPNRQVTSQREADDLLLTPQPAATKAVIGGNGSKVPPVESSMGSASTEPVRPR